MGRGEAEGLQLLHHCGDGFLRDSGRKEVAEAGACGKLGVGVGGVEREGGEGLEQQPALLGVELCWFFKWRFG